MTVQYTTEIPENSVHMPNPERESPAEVDSYILPHLTWATTWLCFGFVQIYMAGEKWSMNPMTHIKVHKLFGGICIASLATHMYFAHRIASRNPANQKEMIQKGYLGLVTDVCLLAFYGIRYAYLHSKEEDEAKKENFKRMHRFRMITCWLQATVGSGTIVSLPR